MGGSRQSRHQIDDLIICVTSYLYVNRMVTFSINVQILVLMWGLDLHVSRLCSPRSQAYRTPGGTVPSSPPPLPRSGGGRNERCGGSKPGKPSGLPDRRSIYGPSPCRLQCSEKPRLRKNEAQSAVARTVVALHCGPTRTVNPVTALLLIQTDLSYRIETSQSAPRHYKCPMDCFCP